MKKIFQTGLLVLYLFMLFACEEEESDAVIPSTDVPAALAQTWLDQDSYFFQNPFDPLLYNPQSRVWFRGYHSPWDMDPDPGKGLRLSQDGEFIWTLIHDTGVGGCRSTASSYLKGTVVVEDNKIIFHPAIRRAKYRSVCNPSLDYDKYESTQPFSLTYQLAQETDSWGNTVNALKLFNPDGSYYSFFR